MGSKWIATCVLLAWLPPAFAAVNANTASPDELRTVRGIGPSIAQRIVDERRRGPYRSLDDLQARVRGVGESSVRRMAAGGLVVGAAGPSGVAARAAPEVLEGRARPTPEARRRATRERTSDRTASSGGEASR